MKKCPFCGAELNDDCLFCTECGKELPKGNACPHCGAHTNDDDVFCQNCDKKIDEVPLKAEESLNNKSKCPNCGATINDGTMFCHSCGRKIGKPSTETIQNVINTEDDIPHLSTDISETSGKRKIVFPIVVFLVLIALLGVGWYYWNSDKEESLLDMETILNIYKNKNKEHITQVLKANDYTLYKSNDDSECWSEFWIKNTQVKEVKDEMDNVSYEPIENKGGSVTILGGGDIDLLVKVYSDSGFTKWVKQLQRMGFKEEKYEGNPPEEDGWTIMGAHANHFKQYFDGKGNRVEIMKDNERQYYSVFTVEYDNSELTPNQGPALDVDSIENVEEMIIDDENESLAIAYSSPVAFFSEESVLSNLSNKTFKREEYDKISFDEDGIIEGFEEKPKVKVLHYSPQSALVRYTRGGYMYRYIVQINGGKLQVIKADNPLSILYQEGEYNDSPDSSVYSSTITFESEDDVLKKLSYHSFKSNEGIFLLFNEYGRVQTRTRKGDVRVLNFTPQSAVIALLTGYMILEIVGDKIQIVDAVDGMVYSLY